MHRTTDLALKATKQMAAAIGRSMAAMVATERHLLVNLADIGEKEKRFLLDAPVLPFWNCSAHPLRKRSVKFKEAKARSAAYNHVYHAGMSLSLNTEGDLAHPGLRARDRAR